MTGAICGDIIGSSHEFKPIKTKEFELFDRNSRYTDDTVMTCAIAKACINYQTEHDISQFENDVIKYMKSYGKKYLNAGYGQMFYHWILSDSSDPYNSFGNGSAMRVAPVGYVSDSLEETLLLSKVSAEVTHNHPEGIKGAQAVASIIYLLRQGYSKEQIKKYVEKNFYNLDFKIDDIRSNYKFFVSCQKSVPESIMCFLEASDFEDTIRNAVSLGGDADTMAAIAGSLAEVYYGIPEYIESKALSYLDDDLLESVKSFNRIRKK